MGTLYLLSPDGGQSEHDEDQVKIQWRQGDLNGETLCWKEGMQDWTPLPFYFGSMPLAIPAAPSAVQASSRRHYEIRKCPRLLTKFLLVMLGIFLVLELVTLVFHCLDYALFNNSNVTAEEIEAAASRQGKRALIFFAVLITTAIAFLKWIYRANYNSHCFGTRDMRISPGWSVGWFFIPVMNLFKPYQAMSEIWRVSLDPKRWQSQNTPHLLAFWWGLWLLSNTLHQIASQFSLGAESPDALQLAALFSMAAALAGIPLCVCAGLLVHRITKQQQKLTEK